VAEQVGKFLANFRRTSHLLHLQKSKPRAPFRGSAVSEAGVEFSVEFSIQFFPLPLESDKRNKVQERDMLFGRVVLLTAREDRLR
jgi:hypothetical protein